MQTNHNNSELPAIFEFESILDQGKEFTDSEVEAFAADDDIAELIFNITSLIDGVGIKL